MNPSQQKPLTAVVIGVGANVLGMHRPALKSDLIKLVGVADLNAEKGRERADELDCAFFREL